MKAPGWDDVSVETPEGITLAPPNIPPQIRSGDELVVLIQGESQAVVSSAVDAVRGVFGTGVFSVVLGSFIIAKPAPTPERIAIPEHMTVLPSGGSYLCIEDGSIAPGTG